jgi:hypothetical protein
MGVKLVSRGGKTKVVMIADKGSTVSNIRLGGERVDPDPNDWDVQQDTSGRTILLGVLAVLAVGILLAFLW